MISSEETNNLLPNMISIFWKTYDDQKFDHDTRENNTTDFSLFTFDILKSLNQREQDFLIHARLGHIPRKTILQLIKKMAQQELKLTPANSKSYANKQSYIQST